MSVAEHELSADEVLESRTGTRVPFTMVGDWVLMSTLSVQAKLLYALLMAHVNVQDGTRKVWPARETLANWMGFSRPQSVDKYIAELSDFGAVTVVKTQHGLKTRHAYYVNGEAPAGIQTPIRFADFYKARNDERDRVRALEGRPVSAGRAAMRPSAQRESVQPIPAGEDVVRSDEQRCAVPPVDVVRPSAPELDQVTQLNEGEGRASEPAAPERTPDTNPPPPIFKADWRKPRHTWLCSEHLAQFGDSPGVDRPACRKCAEVREWAERNLKAQADALVDTQVDRAERDRAERFAQAERKRAEAEAARELALEARNGSGYAECMALKAKLKKPTPAKRTRRVRSPKEVPAEMSAAAS